MSAYRKAPRRGLRSGVKCTDDWTTLGILLKDLNARTGHKRGVGLPQEQSKEGFRLIYFGPTRQPDELQQSLPQ